MNRVMRGEVCVVTGATSGIGRATARLGARVVIVSSKEGSMTFLKRAGIDGERAFS